MKGKQLAFLLALVVVLGGLGWYLQKGNRSSWSTTAAGTGGKVINLPLNDVAQITIKGGDGEVTIAKKDDVWAVKDRADYPADYAKVSELLRAAWELKTLQDVKVGPSQMSRLELGEPGKGAGAATLLEFKDKDGKRLEALLLGKVLRGDADPQMAQFGQMEGAPKGRYVKPASEGAKVSLVSESFLGADTKAERWLQPAFIKAENLTSVTVAGATDAQKWKLTRETTAGEWKLEDAGPEEKVDASKVSALNFSYSNPSFADVLPPGGKPEDTGLDKPTVATLTTADGFIYTLKIGKPNGENYPVLLDVAGNFAKERTAAAGEKPEDKTKLDEEFKATLKKHEEKLAIEKKFSGPVYLVAKNVVEPLIKDRAALIAEKKPETPAGAAPGGAPGLVPGGASVIPNGPGGLSPDIMEQIKKSLPPGTNIDMKTSPTPAKPVEAVTPPVPAPTAPAPAPAPAEKKE